MKILSALNSRRLRQKEKQRIKLQQSVMQMAKQLAEHYGDHTHIMVKSKKGRWGINSAGRLGRIMSNESFHPVDATILSYPELKNLRKALRARRKQVRVYLSST